MRFRSLAAFASLVVVPAVVTRADAVVELGNGDTVAGSFLAQNETESFRFLVPAGAKLSVVAQGTKKPGRPAPRVDLVLLDPDGADLAAGGGVLVPLATGAKVVNLNVPRSGVHTARVTSAAVGDYSFRAKWRSATRPARAPVGFAFGGDETTVRFAADAGATATLTVASAQATSRPRLVRIASLDGSWTSADFDEPSRAAATAHTVRRVKLGGLGCDYVLTVRQAGATPGDANVSVVLAAPKPKARRIDVTTRQTGAGTLDNYAVGTPVGPSGGRVAPGADGLAPIDGAALDVPPGVLAKPVVAVVSTSDALRPPTGQPCGPAVAVGPATLAFRSVPADPDAAPRVTLPFDPEPFGGDFAALEVWTRDAKGRVRLVEPKSSYVIDAVRGTVTFPVAGGGAFQAFGPAAARPADLDGDGFDDLVAPAPHAAGGAGQVFVYFGRADFAASPPSAPGATLSGPAGDAAFGAWTAVGDVNADGIADLAVTSRSEEAPAFGRVHVYFGGPGFPAQTPDAVFTGTPQAGIDFARRMAIGDVTGDGAADLVVGAPGASVDMTAQGAVYIARGGASFTSHVSSDAEILRIRGTASRLAVGRTVAIGKLGAAATTYLLVAGDGTVQVPEQGRVYLIPAGAGLTAGFVQSTVVAITGSATADRFGADITAVDVDADGANDLVVGAPGVEVPVGAGSITDAGDVYVFLAKDGFATSSASTASVRLSGASGAGEARGTYLGVGRFVGTAPRDLVFASPLRDELPLSQPGAVQVQRSGAAFPSGSQRATGTDDYAHFGRVLPAVDLNGDGRDEIVVAAPGASGGRGAVTVVFGPGGFAGRSVVLVGQTVGDQLGGE